MLLRHPAAKGKLLFAGLFETLNSQRIDVINGLERLTRRQREFAKTIQTEQKRAAAVGAPAAAKGAAKKTGAKK